MQYAWLGEARKIPDITKPHILRTLLLEEILDGLQCDMQCDREWHQHVVDRLLGVTLYNEFSGIFRFFW